MNAARMERAGRRAKAGSLSGLSGGLAGGAGAGAGAGVRRQRSLEWAGDRYSSSDDDRPPAPPLADRVFASLLAQATQQFDNTPHCDIPAHRRNIVERTKKMAGIVENTFKRIKDSTQDLGKTIYSGLQSSDEKNNLSEEDFRHYEQLVIMKKYPYLDIKELELKYSPSKSARHSIKFASGINLGTGDPGICESVEDGPNVEISNRGLTGFAIPPQHSGRIEMVGIKSKTNGAGLDKLENIAKSLKKPSEHDVLESLKADVKQYAEKK